MIDVEAFLVPWIADTLDYRTVTETPADLLAVVGTVEAPTPLVQIGRAGGPTDDDSVRFDKPTITVDTFGPDKATASAAAIRVHNALFAQLKGVTADGIAICKVQSITAPYMRFYDNTNLRRFHASYGLHITSSS